MSGLVGKIDDHLAGDGALDEVGDGRVVDKLGYQAGWVSAKEARVECRGGGGCLRRRHGCGCEEGDPGAREVENKEKAEPRKRYGQGLYKAIGDGRELNAVSWLQ